VGGKRRFENKYGKYGSKGGGTALTLNFGDAQIGR